MTSMDFPNSAATEIVKSSFLPAIPAALICGAIARRVIHRGRPAAQVEWSVAGMLISGILCAIAGIGITIAGAVVLGVLGLALATPP